MEQITRAVVRGVAVRVGVDLAKRVIQVHAVDAAGQVQNMVAQNRLRQTELNAAMAQAVFEGDAEKRADVMAQRDRWNESNPDTKININMASVIKQVRSMREDKATRLEKASPKGLRAQVRAELAQ